MPENKPKAVISIVNLFGETVYSSGITGGEEKLEINCSKFRKGIYFVRLISDGVELKSSKLIIAK